MGLICGLNLCPGGTMEFLILISLNHILIHFTVKLIIAAWTPPIWKWRVVAVLTHGVTWQGTETHVSGLSGHITHVTWRWWQCPDCAGSQTWIVSSENFIWDFVTRMWYYLYVQIAITFATINDWKTKADINVSKSGKTSSQSWKA